MRLSSLFLLASLATAGGFAPSPSFGAQRSVISSPSLLKMTIDYNDPVVAEEFALVQPMEIEDVEDELRQSGVIAPPTMNEMDMKLMLVELRLRLTGRLNEKDSKPKPKPTKFDTKFEEALYTKPLFAEYYNKLKSQGDYNSMNVVAEYLTDKEGALLRYGKPYAKLISHIEIALNAPPPVKSPKLQFSGFPANMGESGCKVTLEALGAISDFECEEDEDFPILKGTVTYEDIASAKAAVVKYNGMDMGMGATLEITSV